jgi:hypothetical protein
MEQLLDRIRHLESEVQTLRLALEEPKVQRL